MQTLTIQVYKQIRKDVLKSIKTYKYVAFGTETLFLNYNR